MALSAEQRRLRASIAAHAKHAKHDSGESTKAAHAAFLDKFDREVDPDGILPEAERLRRATHARRAHMLRLALKSSQARAARKAKGTAA